MAGSGALAGGRTERSTVTVREATPGELDDAGAAVVTAYAADGLADDSYRAVVADARRRAEDATVAVAVDAAGRVVGSVTLAFHGSRWAQLAAEGEAEFRMLGVVPSHRGQGVGAALTGWCADRARALGSHRLVLSSERSMTAAHRLYAALGFARRPDLDWSPVDGVHLLGFSLDLA